ncbi:vanillyl-alcohol oxidase [Penicillium macrosclerotiorum]|uniref:vanillyl-alcohol oxidase n=1 Tax=Penicillium macrosclerotiorum TaxID=303699 RepID=UPI002546BEC4|nr:vanillyl-alcohol oxidase [Penicillium macrosclerotiorum]KAJ5678798.1 vanillyl-alcohol oxidase [Penicillium macrosclerotiorum]
MSPKTNFPATPLLSEKHNGIPARLFNKAQQAKSAILSIATKAQSKRTQVALPQGVTEIKFHNAIDELRGQLGKEHVELVTNLVDGWAEEKWAN